MLFFADTDRSESWQPRPKLLRCKNTATENRASKRRNCQTDLFFCKLDSCFSDSWLLMTVWALPTTLLWCFVFFFFFSFKCGLSHTSTLACYARPPKNKPPNITALTTHNMGQNPQCFMMGQAHHNSVWQGR